MNRKEILNQLNNEYTLRRKSAQIFAEENKQKALSDKEYLTLELSFRNLVLDISKQEFEGKDTSLLKDKLEKIKQKQQNILKKLNLNPVDLEPNYQCKLCEDRGVVQEGYCSCFKQELNQKLMQLSQINFENIPTLAKYSLQIFEKDKQTNLQKTKDMLIKVASSLNNNKIKNIVITGKTGVGKTYLTKAFAKEVIAQGNTAYYTTAFHLNNLMAKYHTSFSEDRESLLDNILNSDLLIIDDLGIEPILKNVTIEYLMLVINERIHKQLTTIINTNMLPGQILDRYGERIFSRITDKRLGLLINIEGKDLRLVKG